MMAGEHQLRTVIGLRDSRTAILNLDAIGRRVDGILPRRKGAAESRETTIVATVAFLLGRVQRATSGLIDAGLLRHTSGLAPAQVEAALQRLVKSGAATATATSEGWTVVFSDEVLQPAPVAAAVAWDRVLDDLAGHGAAILVFAGIVSLLVTEEEARAGARISAADLEALSGYKPDRVRDVRDELRKAGLIRIERPANGSTNVIALTDRSLGAMADDLGRDSTAAAALAATRAQEEQVPSPSVRPAGATTDVPLPSGPSAGPVSMPQLGAQPAPGPSETVLFIDGKRYVFPADDELTVRRRPGGGHVLTVESLPPT